MRLRNGLLILGCLLFLAGSASASATIRRYALAAGANYGGPDRATLRYAVSDAESFARVMETLGGVYSSDLVNRSMDGHRDARRLSRKDPGARPRGFDDVLIRGGWPNRFG